MKRTHTIKRKISHSRIVTSIRRRIAEFQAARVLRRLDQDTYGEWTEEEGELCRVRSEEFLWNKRNKTSQEELELLVKAEKRARDCRKRNAEKEAEMEAELEMTVWRIEMRAMNDEEIDDAIDAMFVPTLS